MNLISRSHLARPFSKSLCRPIAAVAASLMPLCAAALPLECYVDRRTDAHQCVAPSEIRESEGIRSAPLFTGGPKGVDRTGYTIHTNCSTGVTHLKDRKGVSFAGGDGTETRAVRQLRAIMCEATLRGRKR